MIKAIKPGVVLTSLLVGLVGCAQDVVFDGKGLDVSTAPPVTVPERADSTGSFYTTPILAPSLQCLGTLSHPTYRRDLPPQPEQSVVEDETATGCKIEDGVLYRYSFPGELSTSIGPATDLNGIGI